MKQTDIIQNFCSNANYTLVKFESKTNEERGKILENQEMLKFNLKKHEIHRSNSYKNGNTLFTFNITNRLETNKFTNPLMNILKNMKKIKIIELIYPNVFNWVFDGINIKAYAIIPSGDSNLNGGFSRYGGTDNFIKVLRRHLENVLKSERGLSIDASPFDDIEKVEEIELSLGSINKMNNMHSITINPKWSYVEVILNSKKNRQFSLNMKVLDFKYWLKEVNPDMIFEAKHIKLEKSISLKEGSKIYPPCIKNLMKLKNKGNLNRFMLATFLLSVHNAHEAKFIYYSIMGEDEKKHLKEGDCANQFSYVRNNIKRYTAPSCGHLKKFCDRSCKLSHPIETIQKKLENKNSEE